MQSHSDITRLVPVASSMIKRVHKSTYPAISPLRPELCQQGRTVLITGASAGIGFAIARAFAQAAAARLDLTERLQDVLHDATSRLSTEFPDVKFDARVCDVASLADTSALWKALDAEGINIDVLILNAAHFGEPAQVLATTVSKIHVYVSTAAIHSQEIAAMIPTYSLSKMAGQQMMQILSDEVDPSEMQIVSFHPGTILSETSRNAGLTEDSLPWDDIDLPAHFAALCSTKEAALLHGRFVWAAWDVEQIMSGPVKTRMEADRSFLRLGFQGLDI